MNEERRSGMRELAHAVECLHGEFTEARAEVAQRLHNLEAWKNDEAGPMLAAVRRGIWVISGASVLLSLMAMLVVWVWLQDHALLSRLYDVATESMHRLGEESRINERQQSEIDRMSDRLRPR